MAQIFEERGALDKLEDFTSKFGANYYGLSLNSEQLVLEKEDWQVPYNYSEIVPFMAGETLKWRVKR